MTLLEINNIAVAEWRSAMLEAFQKGRKKGYVVTHVGVSGTEGKSFLLKPLFGVFGDEHLFIAPAKGNFPLMGPPSLDKARAALLDDWRFNEDILSYNLQLLWYEGAPLIIARPQNEHSGHLRYAKDDPVFITTLEADLLSAKKNVKDGDVSMMLKRLRVFRFVTPLANADDTLVACPHCFAKFLLFGPETGMTPRGGGGSPKRSAEATTRTPLAVGWTVEEVVAFLHDIELGHLEEKIRESAVDGKLLASLDVDTLVECLEIKKLQALKIIQRLP